MTRRYRALCSTIGLLAPLTAVTLAPQPVVALGTPPPPGQCVACHGNLYLRHDTGKWFCLCAVQMSCSCCHGGDPQATSEEAAHSGMVASPIGDRPTTCSQSHTVDADQRIAAFATRAGVRSFHADAAAAQAMVPTLPAPEPEAAAALPIEPSRLAVLEMLGAGMLGLVFFGYRCWNADGLSRQRLIPPGGKP